MFFPLADIFLIAISISLIILLAFFLPKLFKKPGQKLPIIDFSFLRYTMESWEIAKEILRAGRFGHKLTLIVIKSIHPADNGKKKIKGNYIYPRNEFLILGTFIHRELRAIDKICFDATNSCYVILLAETSLNDSRIAMDRIFTKIIAAVNIDIKIGFAEFPTHGYSTEDLFKYAIENCYTRFRLSTAVQMKN